MKALPLLIGLTLAVAGCGGGAHDGNTTSTAADTRGVHAAGTIAFRRYTDDSQSEGSVFTIRPDATGERSISHPPAGHVDDMPAVSADGRQIAFERCGDPDPCQVWVVKADGTNPRRVHVRCPSSPPCGNSGPSWSPDGRLAITLNSGRLKQVGSGDQIEGSEIVVVDLARGTQRSVARAAPYQADLERPVWSPDGRQIAYQRLWSALSNRAGNGGLEVVSATGGRPRPITPYSIAAGDGPDWSPDGRWIVFRTHSDSERGPTNLAVVHPDGTKLHALTHFDAAKHRVLSSSYSPDGRWIAYGARINEGPADVYVMRSDGTGSRPVTRTAAWDSAPDWGAG
jgi:Tol biopolymer transport system component